MFNFAFLAPVANPKARDSAPVIALHLPLAGLTFGTTFLIISLEISVFSAYL